MAVYLDVLPRISVAEAEAVLTKFKGTVSDIGKKIGVDFGQNAAAGVKILEDETRKAEVVVSDSYRRMTTAVGQFEAAELRAAEVSKARGAESAAAAAALTKQHDSYMKASQAINAHNDAQAAAVVSSGRLATAHDNTGKSMLTASNIFNGVGIASILGVGYAMDKSSKSAGDFQAQMIKLTSSAGESAGNLATVQDGILKLSSQTGTTANDLADGMFLVEKAGYRGADGVKVLTTATQLANAEGADLKEVINGLTTTMRDFNVPLDQSASYASKLNVAVAASKTTLQEFTGSLHSVEPLAASLKIKVEDLWSVMAQNIASGAAPDQVTENMRNALNALSGASGPARDAMAQMGISADDVSQHLDQRGLAGTLQFLSDSIKKHLDPNNLINVGEFKQNAQELDNMTNSMSAMGPAAQKLAEGYRAGTVTAGEWRLEMRKQSGDDIARLGTFKKQADDLNNFSTRYKNGQSTLETYNKAMKDVTGTVAGQTVALQVTGENAGATNDLMKKLEGTTQELDGTVKGFNETQEGLAAKQKDASAAFHAAGIELGTVFVPVLTHVANGLKDVGDFLAEHKKLGEGLIYVIGGIGTAWLVAKGIMVFDTIIDGLGRLVTSIGLVKTASLETNTALAAAGPAAATGAAGVDVAAAAEVGAMGRVATAAKSAAFQLGLVAAAAVAGYEVADKLAHNNSLRAFEHDNPLGHNPISRFINRNTPDWLGGDTIDSNGDVATDDQLRRDRNRNAPETFGTDTFGGTGLGGQRPLYTANDPGNTPGAYAPVQGGSLFGANQVPVDSPSLFGGQYAIVPPPAAPGTTPTAADANAVAHDPSYDANPAAAGGGGSSSAKGSKPEVPYGSDFSQAPRPGETSQQYSAEQAFAEAQHKTAEARAALQQVEQDGTHTTEQLTKARNDLAKAEGDQYQAQLRLNEATDKTANISNKAASSLGEVGAKLDQDFGISKGLPGIVENLTKFLGNIAAAPFLAQMNAVSAGSQGGSGIIGALGAQGAFGPQFTGLGGGASSGYGAPSSYGASDSGGGGGASSGGAATAGYSGAVPAGKGAEGWRSTVATTFDKYAAQVGIPADKKQQWVDAIVSQIGTESGGNPNASNPHDSNGRGGTQDVEGLLQYLPSSYANSGGKLTGLPYMDPVGQIAGALFAPQNADGSPSGIGHGVGWGPVSKNVSGSAGAGLPDRLPGGAGGGEGYGAGAPAAGGEATQIGGLAAPQGTGKGGISVGEGIAGAAGSIPGIGQAAAAGGKLASRAIQFGSQAAGIGVQGLMETFLPTGGSKLAQNNWLTKIAGGLAGAGLDLPNTAGKSAAPQQPKQDGQGGKDAAGHTTNVTVNNHAATDAGTHREAAWHAENSYSPPGMS